MPQTSQTAGSAQGKFGLQLERRLWNLNLIAFATMLAILVTLLVKGLNGWAVIPLALVIATFVVGVLFNRVPEPQSNE
jgi:O-antigen ligase